MGNLILRVQEGFEIYWGMCVEMFKFLLHDPRGQALWITSIALSFACMIITMAGFIFWIKSKE